MRRFLLALVSVLGLTAAANACDYGVQAVRLLQVNDHCAPAVQQVVIERQYAAPVLVQRQQVKVQPVVIRRQQVKVQQVKVREVRVERVRVRGY
jgi:hypothetical protein